MGVLPQEQEKPVMQIEDKLKKLKEVYEDNFAVTVFCVKGKFVIGASREIVDEPPVEQQ